MRWHVLVEMTGWVTSAVPYLSGSEANAKKAPSDAGRCPS